MPRLATRLPISVLILVLVSGCAGTGVGGSSSPSLGTLPSAADPGTPRATVLPSPVSTPTGSLAEPTAAGRIVFYDDRIASPRQQIYIENADGTNVQHLVDSDFDDAKPVLSPDGRTIAFTRYALDGAPRSKDAGVFLVNVDGTGLRQLDTDTEDVSWSRDGKQLVETRALFGSGSTPDNVALWVMNADGSGAHQVTLKGITCLDVCANGAQDNRAVWSPDGKRLLFTRDTYTSPEQFALFTVAIDGSDLRRVTPAGLNADGAAWSPDGSLIAFQTPPEANEGGEQNIEVIHPDGSGLAALTAHLSSSAIGRQGTNHASWSPDGSQIVFSHDPGLNGVADLFVMDRDGSNLHVIAETALNENAPAWGRFPN